MLMIVTQTDEIRWVNDVTKQKTKCLGLHVTNSARVGATVTWFYNGLVQDATQSITRTQSVSTSNLWSTLKLVMEQKTILTFSFLSLGDLTLAGVWLSTSGILSGGWDIVCRLFASLYSSSGFTPLKAVDQCKKVTLYHTRQIKCKTYDPYSSKLTVFQSTIVQIVVQAVRLVFSSFRNASCLNTETWTPTWEIVCFFGWLLATSVWRKCDVPRKSSTTS